MSRCPRLLIVASHPVQYASPVFRRIAADPRVDLTIAYCSLQGAHGGYDAEFGREIQWDVPLLDGYRWLEIPNRSPRPGTGRFWGLVNPGLWRLIRTGGFDAVAVYTGYVYASYWISFFAAKWGGVPFVMASDAHEMSNRGAAAWKRTVKKWLWPRLFRTGEAVIVVSSGGVELMRSLGIPGERIVLVPFVVDNDWWRQRSAAVSRQAVRAKWDIPDEAPVALYCAKIQPWKRPLDALRAFARSGVPEAYLVIAGDGPLRADLEREANALNVASRVRFLGFVNQSALPEVYSSADVLVLPSGHEPFGLVVNEAMLSGCVVIVSDRVGARFDLVRDDETGFVYPCGDVESLAARLREVLSDRALRARLATAARQRMETWGPREYVKAIVTMTQRLAAGPQSDSEKGCL